MVKSTSSAVGAASSNSVRVWHQVAFSLTRSRAFERVRTRGDGLKNLALLDYC